jgi:hypothetical protein
VAPGGYPQEYVTAARGADGKVLLTAYPYSKVWSQVPSGVLSPGHPNQARTLSIRVMRPPAVHLALGLAGWLRRGLRG